MNLESLYGVEYNQITIAVDGYMSFGNHEVSCHRNYPIPGAGGPSPMIAPFWDDLKTGSSGNIYKYVTDEMVIIQWDYLRTYENNSRETFQVILYNPEYSEYETVTGDGEIKIQYYDFNNTSDGNWSSYPPMHGSYSTIGIKDHLGGTGLEYSYNSNYFARIGYVFNHDSRGLSYGFGLSGIPLQSFGELKIDFGFSSFNDLENVWIASIGMQL